MDFIEQYINMTMVLLSLLIWVAVLGQRRIFEALLIHYNINIKTAKLWRSVFLPLGGPGTGIILAILLPLTLPAIYVGITGKIFAGVVCGLASGKVYQIFKQLLTNKLTQLTQKVETKVTVTATKTNTVVEEEIDPSKKEEVEDTTV